MAKMTMSDRISVKKKQISGSLGTQLKQNKLSSFPTSFPTKVKLSNNGKQKKKVKEKLVDGEEKVGYIGLTMIHNKS